MKVNKTYKCPFCSRKYLDKSALYDHMEREHQRDLDRLPSAQVYFNFRNKYALTKGYGKSIVTGKPTRFNLTTERYEKFANEKEKLQYREIFKQNMIRKHGKETLLNDPDHQKKMLANRRISGVFVWDDGSETTYTGSYEKAFLDFLNLKYNWDSPSDIMAPAPMIINYVDEDGTERFHIPDFYIQSINLLVNIKSSTNNGYRLRDIETEQLEDEAIKKTNFNYIKIYDNNFKEFAKAFAYLQDLEPEEIPKRVYII